MSDFASEYQRDVSLAWQRAHVWDVAIISCFHSSEASKWVQCEGQDVPSWEKVLSSTKAGGFKRKVKVRVSQFCLAPQQKSVTRSILDGGQFYDHLWVTGFSYVIKSRLKMSRFLLRILTDEDR